MYFEKNAAYRGLVYGSLDIRIEQNISKSWYTHTYQDKRSLFRYRNIPVWNSQLAIVQILSK